MQVQPSNQTQSLQVQQQNQVRKMDGSGNGQGLKNGSNCSATQTTGAAQQCSVPLAANSTFSTFA